jgi:hypothetical protein
MGENWLFAKLAIGPYQEIEAPAPQNQMDKTKYAD